MSTFSDMVSLLRERTRQAYMYFGICDIFDVALY